MTPPMARVRLKGYSPNVSQCRGTGNPTVILESGYHDSSSRADQSSSSCIAKMARTAAMSPEFPSENQGARSNTKAGALFVSGRGSGYYAPVPAT
jgi:hypothetical protein